MQTFPLETRVAQQLKSYLTFFPQEHSRFTLLQKQLQSWENLGTRKNFTGHMTASGYVLKGDELLMIHNINLDKRLAPGGHWEIGDNELCNTAKREIQEETWIQNCNLISRHHEHQLLPLDIDTHFIPANPKKQEPEHYHHDFRYVFSLHEKQDIDLQLEEVSAGGWRKLREVSDDAGFESIKAKILDCVLLD